MEPRVLGARPCVKLGCHLLETYRLINLAYYKKQRSKEKLTKGAKDAKQPPEAPVGDYYVPDEHEVLHARYRVTGKKMGKGSFGQVLEAVDMQTNKPVAIKIIKNRKAFERQVQSEIDILEYLHRSRHGHDNHIVQMLDKFVHKGHHCLVFELLSYNLFQLLQSTKYAGIGLKLLRKFMKQVLESLRYLADSSIIHCDLKPENIVLVNQSKSQVKLIDFGSSCRVGKEIFQYLQSRFYRAPEVILGLKYTAAIDMWSLGCILVEMHSGSPLFDGANVMDQLHKIVHVLGMVPAPMIDQLHVLQRNKYFERTSTGYALKPTSEAEPPPAVQRTLYDIATCNGRRFGEKGHSLDEYAAFTDLVAKMLEYDPRKRITPSEALQHPFFHDDASSIPRPKDKKRSTKGQCSASASIPGDDVECAHRAKQRKLLVPDA
ncbi:CMGC/DYRK/DYRK1 protein kinase [Saprolegnia parasitica CBS 223.65]|uniref:CMGC/DYRK/DYRK1 protein kinase n=1 Tax=Saprolegnia parasitica (strain CBS 223.65) TaxID=695850 RepID=A0A067CLH4_SAPPC|nr:CMGC/DYRK/DYRK1 protein kinase [Saprolegnia parasitica CBS 223.65]KDO30065.1 CMGC/DYRK/DYRK1 protein kinase [Saprolegnia parasitica CBS 223.65]|eukprot:XP_012199246.1 CMGC/DYRK/DYRK1 protein kinase [Saprolegnia parasitica CBS 223.65]